MNPARFFLVATALTSGWVVACSTDDGAKKADTGGGLFGGGEDTGPARIAGDSFDEGCCTKREFDLNRDAKPDAYVYMKVVDDESKVVRKENDINFDGKIDIIRTLDDRGNLVQERLDSDFDGRIDVVVILEKGKIVRKEYDTNFDTKVDMWRYFEKDALAREEADLNYDGKVDYWEYFEAGKLDRVGIDRDNDGNVDEWIQSEAS